MQQLGWTKPPVVESKAAPVTQTAPMVAGKQPTTALDPQQVQQIKADVGAVREAVERQLAEIRKTVEQLAAGQELVVREVDRLQAANEEILAKIPTPPPKRPAPHANSRNGWVPLSKTFNAISQNLRRICKAIFCSRGCPASL
jgi:hypothetical protein